MCMAKFSKPILKLSNNKPFYFFGMYNTKIKATTDLLKHIRILFLQFSIDWAVIERLLKCLINWTSIMEWVNKLEMYYEENVMKLATTKKPNRRYS